MKVVKIIIAIFLFANVNVSAQASYKISDPVTIKGWNNNAEEVFAKSKANNNSPVLMNFTGSDWCGWCVKLKREVFDTPKFKAWVKEKNIELLEVDFPKKITQSEKLKSQNASLAKEIGIRGYPTIVIIANGKAIRTGYVKGGPDAWIKSIADQIKL